MLYALSRDRKWQVMQSVDRVTGTPVRAVWALAGMAMAVSLSLAFSTTAFAGLTSLATAGLYLSYIPPVFYKLKNRSHFDSGPFTMGR